MKVDGKMNQNRPDKTDKQTNRQTDTLQLYISKILLIKGQKWNP